MCNCKQKAAGEVESRQQVRAIKDIMNYGVQTQDIETMLEIVHRWFLTKQYKNETAILYTKVKLNLFTFN